MNIFGEGFPKEIIDQVNARQKAYGSGFTTTRTPEEIIYLNANTSWCKMLSSVNVQDLDKINNETIKQIGLKGDALSRKYVLFNGTSEYIGAKDGGNGSTNNPRSGIGPDGAYGIGGNEFGITPMMGIQSVSVTHENRGSLRRANVKIKAWNKAQFEIIDVLYLRLGFTVLLEWGNSMYYDKKGALETNPNDSLDFKFMNGDLSYASFLKRIHKNRLDSAGNYDAMLGKVTNFHWSFNADGSYDITVDLSSVGDIIESLKVNILLENNETFKGIKPKENKEEINKVTNAAEYVDSFASKTSIGTFLWELKSLLNITKNTLNGQDKFISLISTTQENINDAQRLEEEKLQTLRTEAEILLTTQALLRLTGR